MMSSTLIKYLLFAALVIGIVFGIYRAGQNSIQSKWDLAKAEVKEKIIIQKVIEEKITEKIVTKYVDRIKEIKVKGDTIYVKVPEYITREDNARCVIGNGFVRLWDGALQNIVPGPPDETDRAPSGISLTEVATNHAINTNTCLLYKERAIAWEQWVREQKEANK